MFTMSKTLRGAYSAKHIETDNVTGKCYEIIEIEVLSKEETNDFLQNNESHDLNQTNEFQFFEFQIDNHSKAEGSVHSYNSKEENVSFTGNKIQSTSFNSKSICRNCAANCALQCTQNISEKEQKRIHEHFWKLTAQQKKLFYNTFVRYDQINEGRKMRNFQYYLPVLNETLQVCKWYFLITLDVTDRELLKHFDQQYENELVAQGYDIQEVKDHICRCFADDQLTAAKMYMLYKEKSKNPVDIITYKSILNKLCEKINSTALALENQIELEEEVNLESTKVKRIEMMDNSTVDFQHMFEAHAFNIKTHIEGNQILDEIDLSNDLFDIDGTDTQSRWNISKQLPTGTDDLKAKLNLAFKSIGVSERDSEIYLPTCMDISKDALINKPQGMKRPRVRNPDLWQQNVRQKLCQKGLPYIDKNGVERPGKEVGGICGSNCLFACMTDFSSEARQRIHCNFWNLSTQEKRNFFATYVRRVDIKKRSDKCKSEIEPRKKNSFQYFLPMSDKKVRVCKYFFLQTLAISEAKILYYFETYHNNEVAKSCAILPGRGRKSTLQARLQKVREHISSFPADNALSVSKMYKLYREITENPVGIDAYRRARTQALTTANLNSESERDADAKSERQNELIDSYEVINSKNLCVSISSPLKEENSMGIEEVEQFFEEYVSSDVDEEILVESSSDEQTLSHNASERFVERTRRPELWKQNVRIKQRRQGLAYIDRNGVQRAAKAVGPVCVSTCSYLCTKHFTDEERQQIHSHFWNLTDQGKRDFYETYVENVHVKKRTKESRNVDGPKRKRSFRYYLPLADKPIRVCQFYFLKTLAVSDAKVHYYFEKYHKDDFGIRPGRGRKGFPQSRIQEVEDHVKSYPISKRKLSAVRMYESYKKLTENPVCIDIYRRIKQKLLDGKTSSKLKPIISSSKSCKDIAVEKKNQPTNRVTNQRDKRSINSSDSTDIKNEIVKKKERILGPPCDINCYHSCSTKISKSERIFIHTEFWKLTKEEQQEFYSNYIEPVAIKRRTKPCKFKSLKKQSFSYNLPVGDDTLTVCRKYFLNTLAISDKRLYYFLSQQKDLT